MCGDLRLQLTAAVCPWMQVASSSMLLASMQRHQLPCCDAPFAALSPHEH